MTDKAAANEKPMLRRHQKVVAARDLPGVPAGTEGVVLLVSGLSWIRYRVAFENGVERGSLNRQDLATLDEWRRMSSQRAVRGDNASGKVAA